MGKCKCERCGTMFTDEDYEPGDEDTPLVCDPCYIALDQLDQLDQLEPGDMRHA